MPTSLRHHSTLLVLVVCAALLLGGCGAMQRHFETTNLTTTEITQFSGASSRLIEQVFGGSYRDEALEQRLDQLVVNLQSAIDGNAEPVRVWIVNDSIPRSYAVPGQILLSRGLVATLKQDGLLAAVLAHELGHLRAGHWQRSLRDKPFAPVLLATNFSEAKPSPADVMQRRAEDYVSFLLEDGFPREDEKEAEALGRDMLARSGYDPGLVVLSRNLLEGAMAGREILGWPRTHPDRGLRSGRDRTGFQVSPEGAPTYMTDLLSMQAGYRLLDKAHLLERAGNVVEAIPVYMDAATLAPEQSLILTGLGMAYLQVGELTAAHLNLRRAILNDGGYYRSRFGYGFVLDRMGRSDEAIVQLQRSIELLPTVKAVFLLARCHARRGDIDRAVNLFRRVAAGKDTDLAKQAHQAIRELNKDE